MKKVILWLLALTLALGCLPLSAVALTAASSEIPAEAETWEKDGVTYTVLRTAEDFSNLASGGKYILAADVDFGGKETDYLIALSGTILLDGNCHSITGYTLKGDADVATFQVKTGSNLTIRNLTFGSAEAPIAVSTATSGKSLGTLFAYANCTFTAENLTVYTNVSATGCYAGGMFGNIQGNATVKDCKVYGTLKNGTGTGARGGIFGQINNNLTAVVTDCYSYLDFTESGYNTGGIAGRIVSGKPVELKGCANFGTVRATQYGGGIVGQIQPKNVAVDYTFEDCHNYGPILGGSYSGGLFGDVGTDTGVTGGEMKIIGCTNRASVTGVKDMSGIVGRFNCKFPVTVKNCANFGSVTGAENTAGFSASVALSDQKLTVDGFLNVGTVTAGTRASGGVTGWLHASSTFEFQNCINLGSISGTLAGNLMASVTANVTLTDSYAFSTALNSTGGTGGYVIANPGNAAYTSSGVRYLLADGVEWNTAGADTAMTLAEAVETLNASFASVWGSFLPNSTNDGIVIASPKLAGVQETAVTDGKQSVRFIGLLQNSLQYSAVGFEVTVGETSLGSHQTSKVFQQLLAKENGALAKVTAEQLGGAYLYALTVTNLPAEGVVTIVIKPFGVSVDGTQIYEGDTYAVTYENGVYLKSEKITQEVMQ